jgi:hypothetical protein
LASGLGGAPPPSREPAISAAIATCLSTLLIVAGQSNALGYGVTRAELPARIAPDPRVRIWSGGRFVTMRPGVNTGTALNPDAWGPEAEFADRWRRGHPKGGLYIVKVTKGSTGVAPDPRELDWAPRSRELYAETTAAVAAARAALREPVATVVLWHQGEQDAADRAKAAAYAANFAELRRRMLATWGDPQLIVARINGTLWAGSPVRAVQDRYGAYSTDGFPLQRDRLHLSAEGQVRNGAAAYSEYRKAAHACGAAKVG